VNCDRPLDSRRSQTKTDWLVWAAAATANSTVSKMLLDGVSSHLNSGKTNAPFSDWYDTASGESPGFRSRPVVGGHFAFLAKDTLALQRSKAFVEQAKEQIVFGVA